MWGPKVLTILDKILDKKREELIEATAVVSAVEMRDRAESVSEAPRGFRAALSASASPAIIAEIKRRSPSRGTRGSSSTACRRPP